MLCAMPLPALRNLEIMPIEQDGQTLICLQDPEGVVGDPAVLSPIAYFVASQLDGTNEVTDIQYAFAQHAPGSLLMSDDIMKVVAFLDQHGFLNTEEYAARRKRILDCFAASEVRPAYMAGKSYPDNAEGLRGFLEDLFAKCGEASSGAAGETRPRLRGLVAPHIDFQRGGLAYAQGYRRLQEQGAPRTVFVFGVAHAGGFVPFILTRKHFETPLGVIETDTGVVDLLAGACRWDPFEHEILHRTEHSIEFQAVMIAYLYGPSTRIVPVLCGAMGTEDGARHPDEIEEIAAFLGRCREITSDGGGSVAVIAGADLAHVGRRFGDPFDITDGIISRVEQRDREDLAFVMAGDASGFYRSVMKDGNARRVCGLGCIYAALKTLEGNVRHGEILRYDYAPDPAGGIVSFAGIALA